MHDICYHIINSFIINKIMQLEEIYNYVNFRYDNSIQITGVKTEISKLIRRKLISFKNEKYMLTPEGNVVLDDQKLYHVRIIVKFYKKYRKDSKKFALKEVRTEQSRLRNNLINNKEHKCVLCCKFLPLCLLETAHLKPRCLLKASEKDDNNVCEFMCRYCHKLYDSGFLGVCKGLLKVSQKLIKNGYDLNYQENEIVNCYNERNKHYFDFHYKNIFIEIKC